MSTAPHLTRRRTLALTAAALAVPALVPLRPAAASPVYVEDRIAIDGSDTVAYFDGNGPVAGRADITADWDGAVWRFATAANRDRFLAEPTRWAPQYGGYCAFAMAQGYVAPTVPEAWTLDGGKLYLNFDLRVRDRWDQNRAGFIRQADANWPGIRTTLV